MYGVVDYTAQPSPEDKPGVPPGPPCCLGIKSILGSHTHFANYCKCYCHTQHGCPIPGVGEHPQLALRSTGQACSIIRVIGSTWAREDLLSPPSQAKLLCHPKSARAWQHKKSKNLCPIFLMLHSIKSTKTPLVS